MLLWFPISFKLIPFCFVSYSVLVFSPYTMAGSESQVSLWCFMIDLVLDPWNWNIFLKKNLAYLSTELDYSFFYQLNFSIYDLWFRFVAFIMMFHDNWVFLILSSYNEKIVQFFFKIRKWWPEMTILKLLIFFLTHIVKMNFWAKELVFFLEKKTTY